MFQDHFSSFLSSWILIVAEFLQQWFSNFNLWSIYNIHHNVNIIKCPIKLTMTLDCISWSGVSLQERGWYLAPLLSFRQWMFVENKLQFNTGVRNINKSYAIYFISQQITHGQKVSRQEKEQKRHKRSLIPVKWILSDQLLMRGSWWDRQQTASADK